ncbi:50S ribosomal protein L15 [Patescibacteria group bacterium]|nr:50S ribosomal protein L15 [Patescibacteria group bacterium]
MLSLHNLEKPKANRKPKRRLGRGNSSGLGTYSGKGLKGQKARSGGRAGIAGRSIKSYLLRIPKVRGFKSIYKSMATVNIGDLEKAFKNGQTVNDRAILKAGIVENIDKGIKILSSGKLTKNLTVEANAFSQSAKEKIESAGGKAIIVGKLKSSKVEKPKDEGVSKDEKNK